MRKVVSPFIFLVLLIAGCHGSSHDDAGPDASPSDSDTGTETGSGTDSDAGCVPAERQQCGDGGDIHSLDSCGNQGPVVEDCPDQHSECVNLDDASAECRCTGGWYGSDCTELCVRFVDVDATPGGDGLSWGTAFDTVQSGIDAAAEAWPVLPGARACEVWVAEGTYYIYQTSSEDTVQLRPGVHLYGGFVGTEINLDGRNFETNVTALNGHDNGSGTNQVLYAVTGSDGAVIDGLSITGAGGSGGSGMLNEMASPIVRHCRFYENGIKNDKSSAQIDSCHFQGNGRLSIEDIGILNFNSYVSISHCIIVGYGNGVYSYGEGAYSILIDNCIFHKNAEAVVLSNSGDSVIQNSIFMDSQESGLLIDSGFVTVFNALFIGNGGSAASNGCESSGATCGYVTVFGVDFVSNTYGISTAGLAVPKWGCVDNANSYVYNSIFWNNSKDQINIGVDEAGNDCGYTERAEDPDRVQPHASLAQRHVGAAHAPVGPVRARAAQRQRGKARLLFRCVRQRRERLRALHHRR